MKLILLGAPGAGKGTQAEILSAKAGHPHHFHRQHPACRHQERYAHRPAGQGATWTPASWCPMKSSSASSRSACSESDCANGYILDGVPRTIAQAEALEQAGISFDAVVAIEISDEEIIGSHEWPPCLRELRRQLPRRGHPPEEGGRLRRVRRQARSCARMMTPRRSGTVWRSIIERQSP